MSRPDAIGALTQSLARPVSLGLLPAAHAYAAVAVAVARLQPRVADLDGAIGTWWYIFGEHVRVITMRRNLVAHRIRRTLKPMIGTHQPWNVLMATAHDLNGADGFPMGEDEVSELVRAEVWLALPPAPRRHFHG